MCVLLFCTSTRKNTIYEYRCPLEKQLLSTSTPATFRDDPYTFFMDIANANCSENCNLFNCDVIGILGMNTSSSFALTVKHKTMKAKHPHTVHGGNTFRSPAGSTWTIDHCGDNSPRCWWVSNKRCTMPYTLARNTWTIKQASKERKKTNEWRKFISIHREIRTLLLAVVHNILFDI